MTIDTAYRAATYTVIGLMFAALAFCLFSMAGCSSLWGAVKSAAAPAGGAGAGALIGSAAGPAGTIGGAMIGAAAADSIEENSSLRSGETIGEGALDREIERLKSRVIHAESGLSVTGQALRAAEAGEAWLFAAIKWAMAGLAAWFLWRNRANFRDHGLVNGVKHAICGGQVGKRKAVE